MRIEIQTIPHDQQRYDTVGDWFIRPDGTWVIFVSRLGDWRKEICVAIHELIEMSMCQYDGVAPSSIDEFDIAFEARREKGDTSEPGDDSLAPYAKQHCIATGIERILAAMLGVSWSDYDKAINEL